MNTINEFPSGEKAISLPGPAGNLELLTSMPNNVHASIIGVVCHPHPLFGGTMHNKVVYTIARAFKEMNIPTVRFNFRGVGASQGNYAEGIGETDDVLAILHWLKTLYPYHHIWLAGFSFGSFVAARATKLWPAVTQLISVAPPVVNFDFTELPPFHCPWLVIQGAQDEVVAPSAVFTWLESLVNPPDIICMQGSSHFFHGQLVELRQTLINALSKNL